MINVEKQTMYWKNTADDDWPVVTLLADNKKYDYALFIAHLVLEKLLKAHIVKATGDLAPRIHDLSQLAKIAKLELPDGWLDYLAKFNRYNIEGRYPGNDKGRVTPDIAVSELSRVLEVREWLIQKL